MLAEGATDKLFGAAIEVYRALGPGLIEPAYEGCLCAGLDLRGVTYRRQVAIQWIPGSASETGRSPCLRVSLVKTKCVM